MIWYRHWVDMRVGVLFLLSLCVWMGATVVGPWRSLEYGAPLVATPLAMAIGADQVLVWAEFAGRILPFSLMVTVTLAGAGFRTMFTPVAPAVYTLTLPISRSQLIWTRLVAALTVATLLGTILSAGGVVWFLAHGRAVPFTAILQSLLLGLVLQAAMLAFMSAVVTALPTVWSFLGFLFLLLFAIPNSYVVSAPARGDVPWLALGGYVIAMVAAVAFTLAYVRTREY